MSSVPTADQFETAARDFDDAAERVAGYSTGLVRSVDPGAIIGGPVADAIGDTVSALLDHAVVAGTRCAALADLCRDRARVCRDHDDAWRNYDIAFDEWQRHASAALPSGYVGSPPRPPVRPAPWVERSM